MLPLPSTAPHHDVEAIGQTFVVEQCCTATANEQHRNRHGLLGRLEQYYSGMIKALRWMLHREQDGHSLHDAEP